MATAIGFGKGLYGAEVDPPTSKQLEQLRKDMAMAIWGDRGPRNRGAMLLLFNKGRAEPWLRIARQRVRRWKRIGRMKDWKSIGAGEPRTVGGLKDG